MNTAMGEKTRQNTTLIPRNTKLILQHINIILQTARRSTDLAVVQTGLTIAIDARELVFAKPRPENNILSTDL